MNRVFVIGVGPTPLDSEARQVYAPGLRLWNFIREIMKGGMEVVVGEWLLSEEEINEDGVPKTVLDKDIIWYSLPRDSRRAAERIAEIATKEKVTAIISTTEITNAAAASSGVEIPLWLDFNGDPMTERQLQAAVYGSDEGLIDQWTLMIPSLLRGDHFSTCSEPQKNALIGQLGVCGRLNQYTARHALVDSLPPGPTNLELPPPSGSRCIRGNIVNPDDFVVLWTGGYNTWTDIDTLFKGLESAMSRNPSVHYVSTGGEIKGHDDKTFARFQQRINGSRFKDRFHFAGWVELRELVDFYYDADTAINIDFFSYEAILGCRNRLFDWIVAELPIITTPLSEITRLLSEKNLVTPLPSGEWETLSDIIIDMTRNRTMYKDKAKRANEFLLKEYTNDKLLAPLVKWARNPQQAPDLEQRKNDLMNIQEDMIRQGWLIRSLQKHNQELKSKLQRIEGSRLYRLMNIFKRF